MKILLLLLLLTSCSSTHKRNIGNKNFLVSADYDSGKRDFGAIRPQPERGFSSEVKPVDCKRNTIAATGYYVKAFPPSGQGLTDWKEYLEAEKYRVAQCAITGLWCSTSNKQGKVERGANCFFSPDQDHSSRNDQFYRITESLIPNIVACSALRNSPEYSGPLKTLLQHMVWKRNAVLWATFCRKYKTSAQCEVILPWPDHELQYGVRNEDLMKAAVSILIDTSPKIREEQENVLWAAIEADIKPICDDLLEERVKQ